MKKTLLVFLLLIGLFFANIGSASADGIIIPEPPICQPPACIVPPLPMQQLDIKYHHVSVVIKDQIATTHVDQVFYNPNDYTIEGTYIFPLPMDAVISHFILWIDGKAVEGQVMDAGQARQMYEDIVRKMQDPALLEYTGRGAVQARVYPIPPKGERRIELEYQQVIPSESGLFHYNYPLNTEKFSAAPLNSVSVTVDLQTDQPIRAVYSPSHPIDTQRVNEQHVIASYEAENVRPATDFSLYYSVGDTAALHLLSYRDASNTSDPDGFFMLLLAPKVGGETEVVSKDVLLILDRSGSMEGEKFRQAQQALIYILDRLHSSDRFFLLAFSSNTEAYSRSLEPAAKVEDAKRWVNQLSASGSTDIDRALQESASIVDSVRPTYLIFLTDGLPTKGVIDSGQILANLKQEMPGNVRLFPFGVGYDVDTYLLDSMAQDQHGLSTYIKPEDPLDQALSNFYEKISTPVLTNLDIRFNSLEIFDIYPWPLPDLFEGSQVIITGRYRGGGAVDIKLQGEVNGQKKTMEFTDQRFADGNLETDRGFDSLPRIWATRKIGYLLNQIRLNGADQETINQIIHLGVLYGITTPYTSFLVTEEMPMGAQAQSEAARDTYNQLLAQPTAPSYGMDAVQKAVQGGAMSQAEQAAPQNPADQSSMKIAGSKTFVLKDGIWVDTAFDPGKMQTDLVEFLSPAYFELANSFTDIGAAFALGERVIVVEGGRAIEVTSAGSGKTTITLQSPTPDTTETSQAPDRVTPTALSIQPAEKTGIVWWGWIGGAIVVLFACLILLRRRK